MCPASCSKKDSDLDRYLDIQQLCSDPSNLNEAADQNGGESTGEEQSEEEVTETLVNTNIYSAMWKVLEGHQTTPLDRWMEICEML